VEPGAYYQYISYVTAKIMFLLRLYIATLTLLFLVLTVFTRGIALLEAIVIVCPLVYLILEMRADLHDLRQLEAQVSAFSN
jgi:hypothetical membrane protein